MNEINKKLESRPVTLKSARRALAVFCGVALGLLSGQAQADSVRLAAGDYAPFIARNLPEYGVTAAIVTAAFKTQGTTVNYDFLPWKRGYHLSRVGDYVGTFPYLLTPEREAEFLYSEPIFTDHFRLFVRKNGEAAPVDRVWTGKSICVPLGYDTTQIQAFTTENQLKVEQPPEIANCFSMLEKGRIEAVWVSQLVGRESVRALFGRNREFHPQELPLPGIGSSNYYFIVSRSLPNAQNRIDRFNAGMRVLHQSGAHAKILARFSLQ